MARGRMIDRVIILSKKVNAISEGAENLYYRLNVCADDFGRYHADPEIIKGQAYTKRRISLSSIKIRLDELWAIGLIKLYISNGETYLEIVGFEKHQTFRSDIQRKAEYPIPKDFLQRPRNESDTRCNESDTERCLKLIQVKLIKDNVIQEKAENTGQLFEEFWTNYPKEGRVEKKTAYKKFMAIANAGKLGELKEGFHGYMDYLKHRELNEGFKQRAKDAKTFLNHYDEFKGFKYEPKL